METLESEKEEDGILLIEYYNIAKNVSFFFFFFFREKASQLGQNDSHLSLLNDNFIGKKIITFRGNMIEW